MHYTYHPELHYTPFMLARHGESVRNAGEMSQGQGDEIDGLPPNRLTKIGVEQIESMHSTLAAAGITVHHVNSSRLLRARESATVFVNSHPKPKPTLHEDSIPDLEEVLQVGWEAVNTRPQVKLLRQAALAKETLRLLAAGLHTELEGHVAWTMPLGKGESPLAAALRGIATLEEHGIKPSELAFSHGMLNRLMDAIATRVVGLDRAELLRLLKNTSAVGTIATLHTLKELGVPTLNATNDKRNHQVNGSVTEYTVDHTTDLWVAHRRIEPPLPHDTTAFVEHQRGGDGMWTKVSP